MMGYNILLIEDDVDMADNIASILGLARYKVTHVVNGLLGVAEAQQHPPDLILCDIMMPELDGYGVAHILNSNPETARIPFVFLTAKASAHDFRTGMNYGADDYIAKPFDGVDLLRVVEMRLKKIEILKAGWGQGAAASSQYFDKSGELREFNKPSENRPVRSYKPKDLIFMEGYIPNDLYHIDRGRVKTYKINHDGKELITGIHAEGDFLGYLPLLEEKPYNENAEAMDEVVISAIPKQDFLSLMYANKDVASRFIKMLSSNVEEMENRLLDIAYQSVRNRVASVLLKINEKFSPTDRATLITITRKDISNIIGTATESLNRTLADFKQEGLIEISGDGLKIINKQKLEKLIR